MKLPKNYAIVSTIIRWSASLGLLFAVYTETGIFTVIVLFLIFLNHELNM